MHILSASLQSETQGEGAADVFKKPCTAHSSLRPHCPAIENAPPRKALRSFLEGGECVDQTSLKIQTQATSSFLMPFKLTVQTKDRPSSTGQYRRTQLERITTEQHCQRLHTGPRCAHLALLARKWPDYVLHCILHFHSLPFHTPWLGFSSDGPPQYLSWHDDLLGGRAELARVLSLRFG